MDYGDNNKPEESIDSDAGAKLDLFNVESFQKENKKSPN